MALAAAAEAVAVVKAYDEVAVANREAEVAATTCMPGDGGSDDAFACAAAAERVELDADEEEKAKTGALVAAATHSLATKKFALSSATCTRTS